MGHLPQPLQGLHRQTHSASGMRRANLTNQRRAHDFRVGVDRHLTKLDRLFRIVRAKLVSAMPNIDGP